MVNTVLDILIAPGNLQESILLVCYNCDAGYETDRIDL